MSEQKPKPKPKRRGRPPKTERKKCDTCRFFTAIGTGVGTCRRYPPMNPGINWNEATKVHVSDWCGEWEKEQ